jgi:hypothetical protein
VPFGMTPWKTGARRAFRLGNFAYSPARVSKLEDRALRDKVPNRFG